MAKRTSDAVIMLEGWGIWLNARKQVHLAGYPLGFIKGHCSAPVATFNPLAMVASAQGGCVYHLIGPGNYVESLILIHHLHPNMLNNWHWLTPRELVRLMARQKQGEDQ